MKRYRAATRDLAFGLVFLFLMSLRILFIRVSGADPTEVAVWAFSIGATVMLLAFLAGRESTRKLQ